MKCAHEHPQSTSAAVSGGHPVQNGKIFIWMQLLGFNRDEPDRGVASYFARTGFVPDGVCALLYQSDFFHQHRGMETEYELPADVCAYIGIPRNKERCRQPWTNWDLRELAQNLAAQGSGLYASVMGFPMHNEFHTEWIYDHIELMRHGRSGAEHVNSPGNNICVLKRFRDGSYYEDFLIDRICETLVDYGMKGVHLADGMCPHCHGMLHSLDFSTDYVGQFLDYSGIRLPDALAATMGQDDEACETARANWIYRTHREEWAAFNAWRWERFFTKLCARVHAIGKEVMTLGLYCSDPFETYYCLGIDNAALIRAGVDRLTANIVPTSVYLEGCDYFFHPYMAIAPTTAAHIGRGKLFSMMALQDASEEWNAIQHAPALHEKDLYMASAYQVVDGQGLTRAVDGYYLCLGDGISKEDWDFERERLQIAFSADAEAVYAPMVYWSEAAFAGMMHEFVQTRRWTPHKLFSELSAHGVPCAGCVTADGLAHFSGTLLVPNFDMLPPEEQAAIAAYDRGSVFCTAKPGFDPMAYGITPEIQFCDAFSNYPTEAFAFRCTVDEKTRTALANLLQNDDGTDNLPQNILNVEEPEWTLDGTLVFAKVTEGFRAAMALLVRQIHRSPFTANQPLMVLKQKSGAYRLYLLNENRQQYAKAFVTAHFSGGIREVKTVSKFPVLIHYWDEEKKDYTYLEADDPQFKKSFLIKLAPGGVTVVDVWGNGPWEAFEA